MILHQSSKRLLSLCLSKQSFSPLLDNNITFSHIQEFDRAGYTVVEFIQNFNNTYSQWPNKDTILDELDVDLPDVESEDFAVDSYTKYLNQQRIAKIGEEAINLLADDPQAAVAKFMSVGSVVNPGKGIVSFKSSAKERYLEYREEKRQGELGIPTVWETINELCGGWTKAGVHVWSAEPNVGKTWISCISAALGFEQGHKVLMVSLEDSNKVVQERTESLIYEVSYGRLRHHKLRLMEEIKFKNRLEQIENAKGDIFFAPSDVRSVGDILLLTESYQPDLVIVDAGYRLQVGQSDEWQKIKMITEQLQNAARVTNLPWVVTTQQSTTVKKTLSNADAGNQTRYGKDWRVAATNMFLLQASEDQRNMNLATVRITKMKDATNPTRDTTFEIHWDHENKKFYERSQDEEISVEGLEY